jgi:hypothetical protein
MQPILKMYREAVHEDVRYECPVAECDKSYARRAPCDNHIRWSMVGILLWFPFDVHSSTSLSG